MSCVDFVVIKSKNNAKVRKEHECRLCKKTIKKGELSYYQTSRDNDITFNLITIHLHTDCYTEMKIEREECLECPLFNVDGECSGECTDELYY